MEQRTEVPKFGNWENEDDVPYTTYFENARKAKSGAKMSPDVSEDNTDTLLYEKQSLEVPFSQKEGNLPEIKTGSNHSSQQRHGVVRSVNKSEFESPKYADTSRPKHERQLSQGEGDHKRSNDSSLRHEADSRKAVNSPHHGLGGISTDSPRRVSRQGVGSDRSVEQSPLHPNHQTRLGNKNSGVSSPSWERKSTADSSHGLPSTPARSRLRSVTRGGDDTFQNLVIGMKVTLHQVKGTLKYLTGCERRNRVVQEKFPSCQLSLLTQMDKSTMAMTAQRAVYAFRGVKNEISPFSMKESA